MKLLVLFFCALFFHNAYSAMSEKQLKAAMKLVRNVCQPKFKATDEQIEAMHNGNWEQDKAGQCYLWCILNMHKMVSKDNKFLWEVSIQTLENQAPPSIRDTAIASVKNCKEAGKDVNDKCVLGYEVAKCIYLDNPKNYFLP